MERSREGSLRSYLENHRMLKRSAAISISYRSELCLRRTSPTADERRPPVPDQRKAERGFQAAVEVVLRENSSRERSGSGAKPRTLVPITAGHLLLCGRDEGDPATDARVATPEARSERRFSTSWVLSSEIRPPIHASIHTFGRAKSSKRRIQKPPYKEYSSTRHAICCGRRKGGPSRKECSSSLGKKAV